MTDVKDTPFAKLEAEGRLLKPTLKGDTHVEGRFGFRGDISYDDADTVLKEVFSVSEAGKPAIGFLSGSIKEFETLPKLVETFGPALDANSVNIIYVADLPRGARFYFPIGDIKFFTIFIDDTSVYNELIDITYVDKVKLKKFDTAAKLDALADVGLKYDAVSDFQGVTWDDAVKRKNAG